MCFKQLSTSLLLVLSSLLFSGYIFSSFAQASDELSDTEIKKVLIKNSVGAYSGNCPCPYNSAKNGSRCGKRSAYSKPGGYEPLCYPDDISTKMIEKYRLNNE